MSNQQSIVSGAICNSAVMFDSMMKENHLMNAVMPSVGVMA
jgi:hypothetical protein